MQLYVASLTDLLVHSVCCPPGKKCVFLSWWCHGRSDWWDREDQGGPEAVRQQQPDWRPSQCLPEESGQQDQTLPEDRSSWAEHSPGWPAPDRQVTEEEEEEEEW